MSFDFKHLLSQRILILDGATGTNLQQRGLPAGSSPEQFCLDHPEVIQGLQREYYEAGSDLVSSPTFGANRPKLKNYGMEKDTVEINRRLAELTLTVARQQGRYVAGGLGPTGLFFKPFGEHSIDSAVEIFGEQVKALAAAGVDCILIETMIDIQEARLAVLAAKERCNLPVLVSMTFDDAGRTLTGSDAVTCLNILQTLGADAFGVNCSTGPDRMVDVIRRIQPFARIPIFAKPNAGLPEVRQGRTVFPMDSAVFNAFTEAFWEAGVGLFGGCCGTTPDHIAGAARILKDKRPQPRAQAAGLLLSSPRRTVAVSWSGQAPMATVGERINPTGKPAFQEELRAGQTSLLKQFARQQQEQGADLLDVNVGAAGVDEAAAMQQAVSELAVTSELPLCIDSSRPDVIAAAARAYPGRILINSVSGEPEKMAALLPVVKKYGAAFIAMLLDEHGIPEDLDGRIKVLEKLLAACDRQGISREQVVVDGLVLTVSANPRNAELTLKTVRYAAQHLRLNTVLGLSNISFGLPGRPWLNAAFLAMAAAEGLSMVIANPSAPGLMEIKAGADVLTGRDAQARIWIGRQSAAKPPTAAAAPAPATPEEAVRQAVLTGDAAQLEAALKAALAAGCDARGLVQQHMIPAIQIVGEKYDKREYFLPQLIASAEAMEKGMQMLAPKLGQAGDDSKGRGVLATVKGDVHDIGKKIVALLLRNNGYQVVDLGKSVEADAIIAAAREQGAAFIGLSALMTTTMGEMKTVIERVRALGMAAKVLVGGAVITREYADEIGADGYAADAYQAVDVVNRLLKPTPANS